MIYITNGYVIDPKTQFEGYRDILIREDKTSFHCRCRTAHNIFLIGKAGIPEMYMNVYKPRRNDLTGRINPLNLPFCCFCTVLLLLRIAPLLGAGTGGYGSVEQDGSHRLYG